MGKSTYFIGYMLPTFGIICNLGGFCGPFGPRVGKFAFFDIILLKETNLGDECFFIGYTLPTYGENM